MSAFIPTVSAADRVEGLCNILKETFPFVAETFWGKVKRTPDLDCANFRGDYAPILSALWAEICDSLSPKMLAEIERRYELFVTHIEVATAMDCEPDEESRIWEYWEAVDRAATEDAKWRAYRQEY